MEEKWGKMVRPITIRLSKYFVEKKNRMYVVIYMLNKCCIFNVWW